MQYRELNERLDYNCSSKTSIYIYKEGVDNKVKGVFDRVSDRVSNRVGERVKVSKSVSKSRGRLGRALVVGYKWGYT